MNRMAKKFFKKFVASVLVTSMFAVIIVPFLKVFAENTFTIEFDFTDGTVNGNVVTYTIGETNVTATVSGTITNGVANLGNESWVTSITIDDNYDPDTMQIRVYGNDGFQATYSYNDGTLTRNGTGSLPNSVKFVIEAKQNDYEGGDTNGFDGRAVVLWSCGDGDTGVCFHEFSVVDPEHCDLENPTEACYQEIGNFDNGGSTFFRDTYVTADNKPGTTFDVHAQYKEWYTTDEFYIWQELYRIAYDMEPNAEIDWDTMNRELIMGAPKDGNTFASLEESATDMCGVKPSQNASRSVQEEYERCINLYAAQENHEIWTHELQPVNEPDAANAYVSYGDRNFKVVIYNEDYKAVSTTADFDGLNFYPASWADPFTRRDQYDVSDSDEVNPTPLESILLESTVNLDILDINDYELESVEAMDVPDGAVTITKVNSRKFQIVFLSNFYDHVVFKLTDTSGGEEYVQINRYTIDGWIRNNNTLSADFYYDRTKNYDDFVLTAKVVYNDGTIENVTLEAVEDFQDSLGHPIDGYEADQEASIGPFQGKGLKQSVFECYLGENAERRVKDIYLNAEYVDENDEDYIYAGAYSGSGDGTPANLYHPEESE